MFRTSAQFHSWEYRTLHVVLRETTIKLVGGIDLAFDSGKLNAGQS